MPYIKPENRDTIGGKIDSLISKIEETPDDQLSGTLNYIITRIITASMKNEVKYNKINNLIGVLECVKLELYRRIASRYEDEKIEENGDVKETEEIIHKM